MEPVHYHLSNISFDEFVVFLFDHSVPDDENASSWDWNAYTTFDAQKICSYYVALFRNPEFLRERFSEAQLEQGFWAILGSLDCSAHSIVLEPDGIPFESRVDCIHSMYELFRRLFTVTSLDTSVHMWWDSSATTGPAATEIASVGVRMQRSRMSCSIHCRPFFRLNHRLVKPPRFTDSVTCTIRTLPKSFSVSWTNIRVSARG